MKLRRAKEYLSSKASEAIEANAANQADSNKLKSYKLQANRGLSLIELLVSVSIVIILTSVILAKHSEFSGTILLKNLAYDIALSIRKAQVFGLSVKEFIGGSEFDVGYGIHFDIALPSSYTLFADRPVGGIKNQKYDDSSEDVEVFNIEKRYSISRFCGELSDGTQKCTPSDISKLDIVFERPNPDAIITSGGTAYSRAIITVRSVKGSTQEIAVESTGQIAVK